MNTNKLKKSALTGLALLALALSGCAPEVEGWEVHNSQKFCEPHGGIDHFDVVLGVTAVCTDGSFYRPVIK